MSLNWGWLCWRWICRGDEIAGDEFVLGMTLLEMSLKGRWVCWRWDCWRWVCFGDDFVGDEFVGEMRLLEMSLYWRWVCWGWVCRGWVCMGLSWAGMSCRCWICGDEFVRDELVGHQLIQTCCSNLLFCHFEQRLKKKKKKNNNKVTYGLHDTTWLAGNFNFVSLFSSVQNPATYLGYKIQIFAVVKYANSLHVILLPTLSNCFSQGSREFTLRFVSQDLMSVLLCDAFEEKL